MFGIKVRVHWLFLALVLFLLMYSAYPPGELLAALVVLFGVVFLHELGHSLMARHFGIQVIDITFWPLGGMARMSEIPEDSKVEGLIAVAGPAVNFLLAFLTLPLFLWFVLVRPDPGGELDAWLRAGTSFFLYINLVLGGFNLLPAFPMDGGRILRAVLGRKGDWLAATERAVHVGKIFAVVMFFVGVAFPMGRMLPLIAIFVWFAGSRELMAVRMRHARAMPGFGGFQGFAPARDEFEGARSVHQEAPRPATGSGSADGPGGARRPNWSSDTGAPRSAHGGLSDEEVARLESFPGRLRRPDDED